MAAPDKQDLKKTVADQAAASRNGAAQPAPAADQTSGPVAPVTTEATLPVPREDTLKSFFDLNRKEFAAVIPAAVSVDRLMRLALTAVRRTPVLLTCSMPSIAGAVMQGVSLGLELNTPLQHAYLIPFKNNKTMTTEAQFVIGYQGYIELIYRSGKVKSVYASEVYEKDIFNYQFGTDEFIKHIQSPLPPSKRGAVTHFYAYAHLLTGGSRFVVLTTEEVNAIRDQYSAGYRNDKESSPWATEYAAMGCKTAVRELQKWLPKSAEQAKAIEADYKIVQPGDLQPIDEQQ